MSFCFRGDYEGEGPAVQAHLQVRGAGAQAALAGADHPQSHRAAAQARAQEGWQEKEQPRALQRGAQEVCDRGKHMSCGAFVRMRETYARQIHRVS